MSYRERLYYSMTWCGWNEIKSDPACLRHFKSQLELKIPDGYRLESWEPKDILPVSWVGNPISVYWTCVPV